MKTDIFYKYSVPALQRDYDKYSEIMENTFSESDIFVMEINGEIDLHLFQPNDVVSLVEEYILCCHEKGIREVKIIHGKGKGTLRRKVHYVLHKHPLVSNFYLDKYSRSSWGATIAELI